MQNPSIDDPPSRSPGADARNLAAPGTAGTMAITITRKISCLILREMPAEMSKGSLFHQLRIEKPRILSLDLVARKVRHSPEHIHQVSRRGVIKTHRRNIEQPENRP